MQAPAFGIGSAILWGSADFLGGLAAKRGRVQSIVIVSQTVGLLMLGLVALLSREALPVQAGWLWGLASGIAGAAGVACLYAALASGRMGIAAPITAVLAAGIPVLYGMLSEGLPRPLRIGGFALALLGVWLLGRPDAHHGGADRRTLLLALASGTGFGLFLILLGQAGTHGLYWPLTASRISSVLVMLALLLHARAPLPHGSILSLALLTGLLDATGNIAYVLATQHGRLDVAAVLSSMYPAATVLLARIVLKETLARAQMIGVLLALAAIPLIVL